MPRRRPRSSRAAASDLVGIWRYTFESWGEAQADRYLVRLEHGIRELTEHPERGASRDELRPGYRSKRIEHHVVFYTFTDDELLVRRVLHEAMDVGRHV